MSLSLRPAIGPSNSSGALVRPNDAGAAIDSSDASCSGKSRAETGDVTRLVVEGNPAEPSGVFDPSIVYPKDATAGFLAYSTVSGRLVHTRIAASNDHGATFHYFSDVNNVTPATVATTESRVCGAATCDGRWVHETPSVVVDPTIPTQSSCSRCSHIRTSWMHLKGYTTTSVASRCSPRRLPKGRGKSIESSDKIFVAGCAHGSFSKRIVGSGAVRARRLLHDGARRNHCATSRRSGSHSLGLSDA